MDPLIPNSDADDRFIVAAPDLVARLADEVERLREWKRLHSADVRSIRAEQGELEDERDAERLEADALRDLAATGIDTTARVRELHVCTTEPIRATIDDPAFEICDNCGWRMPCPTRQIVDGEA